MSRLIRPASCADPQSAHQVDRDRSCTNHPLRRMDSRSGGPRCSSSTISSSRFVMARALPVSANQAEAELRLHISPRFHIANFAEPFPTPPSLHSWPDQQPQLLTKRDYILPASFSYFPEHTHVQRLVLVNGYIAEANHGHHRLGDCF